MMEHIESFISLLFMGIIALFPVVNPIGTAFIVNPYFSHLSRADKRRAVKKITIYAFFICTVGLFGGQWILKLFGISIPVIQLAGGIMICKMGWESLSSDKKEEETDEEIGKTTASGNAYRHLHDKLFYPITFPITTGAGTLSVLFTLSAHSTSMDMKHHLINQSAILLSIVIMCVLIYVFFLSTKNIIHFLGSNGERIVNRISAFLVFCVGLQIGISGIKGLGF